MKKVTAGWSLNRVPSLPHLLLALTTFLLPTQLGRHFWPEWSYILGLRSDYLSPTVYLSDILIGFLLAYLGINFLLSWLTSKRPQERFSPALRSYLALAVGLVITAGLSVYYAANPETTWWHTAKLVELALWGAVLSWYLSNRSARRLILAGLLVGSLLQVFLGLGQFLVGHSLGAWVFGERRFDTQTPGIAQAIIDGKLVLRSYGTLPHPNVLGLWMLLSSNLSLYLAWKEKNYESKLFWSVLTILFSLTLLTSLSRLAIVLWLVATAGICGFFFRPTKRMIRQKRSAGLVTLALVLFILILPALSSRFSSLVDSDSQSVSRRVQLSQTAFSLWQEHPWNGIGAGNFVVRLGEVVKADPVRFIQPAHNYYLLVLSEVGIIGLLFAVSLLGLAGWRVYRTGQWLLLLIVAELVIAGLFDHYFWTLQQGGLLWWSIIGGLFSPMVGPEVIPARPPARPS